MCINEGLSCLEHTPGNKAKTREKEHYKNVYVPQSSNPSDSYKSTMSSPPDLKAQTREFLEALCNREFEKALTYVDANAVQEHDDRPPFEGA